MTDGHVAYWGSEYYCSHMAMTLYIAADGSNALYTLVSEKTTSTIQWPVCLSGVDLFVYNLDFRCVIYDK